MSSENINSLRLQQALASCSQSIANGDFKQSEEYISELVRFLDSVSDLIEKDEHDAENSAFEVLSEIYQYLISPSIDQAVTDALAFELPKAVAKLGCVSTRCLENAESIINHFVEICSPRDMVSILCEAMASPSDGFNNSSYFAPLLGTLAKAFEALQRRPFEQLKASLPVVLKVLEALLSDPEHEDTGSADLLNRTILIAHSLKAICEKFELKDEKLFTLFGLYVLQITALISNCMGAETSRCFPMMLELSHFLQFCGLTNIGLITGHEVDIAIDLIFQGDEDDMSCFSYVKPGAALAVLWRNLSNEVADATKEDLDAVKNELRSNRTKRWEAVGMLKHIFASANLPWALKRHAIYFLFCIMEGVVAHKDYDEPLDYLAYTPSLYAALQAIQLVIVYASDPLLRKKAFDTFKMVLADLPPSLRFDILMASIKNSELSSMIAILLGCVKEEMHREYLQKVSGQNGVAEAGNNIFQHSSPFWTVRVLDIVEFVLKPPKGGPPSLPEFTDAVLSALNMYRFVLITESSGNTNYTEVLSKNNLQKVYREWLEPLRTLVAGVAAESQKDDNQLAFDTVCALNPVEFVLHRCIELVEENLKHHS
ncbi:aberrant root formation protein 4 isoform X1 [Cynara cardunculus var. scolymus]|uniref:aberrant root formation protein 4 isoform X1 n=1 Tax=Cynara cardunculus var. scolymus TaxID=59895 RepID=UPI000D627C50|nr:aberrant root formation protein 4 isoform X1 [Cynara cardunculus var. scolymus]